MVASWATHMKHDFYLTEQLTDKLCLFRFEHLAYSFLKMSEVSLSLQGKQLTVFVASDNIWAFKWKLSLENLYLPPDLDSFLILENIFDKISGGFNDCELPVLYV